VQRSYLLIINFLLIVAIVTFLIITNLSQKKGFVLNQEVFTGFKGKVELESKLKELKAEHGAWLDSVRTVIDQTNSQQLITVYDENVSNFQLQEQELSEKYTADIWKRINRYIKEFGDENDYEYIFGASGDGNLMYADDAQNITKPVIEYINEKYTSGK
jgi:outer membrane protein